jgi:hypothetical protein
MTFNQNQTEEVILIVANNLKLNKGFHNGRTSVRPPDEHPLSKVKTADEKLVQDDSSTVAEPSWT